MYHSNFMNVLNSCNELMKHSNGFVLIYSLALNDIVKQFSSFHELHDKKELFGSFDDFVKLYNIWVSY